MKSDLSHHNSGWESLHQTEEELIFVEPNLTVHSAAFFVPENTSKLLRLLYTLINYPEGNETLNCSTKTHNTGCPVPVRKDQVTGTEHDSNYRYGWLSIREHLYLNEHHSLMYLVVLVDTNGFWKSEKFYVGQCAVFLQASWYPTIYGWRKTGSNLGLFHSSSMDSRVNQCEAYTVSQYGCQSKLKLFNLTCFLKII